MCSFCSPWSYPSALLLTTASVSVQMLNYFQQTIVWSLYATAYWNNKDKKEMHGPDMREVRTIATSSTDSLRRRCT